jgi:hypothetical protein
MQMLLAEFRSQTPSEALNHHCEAKARARATLLPEEGRNGAPLLCWASERFESRAILENGSAAPAARRSLFR